MTSVRRWLSGHVVAFGAVLAVLGCSGQSTRSGESSGERGGANSGGSARGGADSGGSATGGTGVGGSSRGGAVSTGGIGTSGTGGATDLIVLEDPNNYTATSELSIPTIETAPGDITVCWTDVTTDIACGEVTPETDVGAIGLLRFRTGSQEEVTDLVNAGELEMSVLDGYVQYEADRQSTCTELSSLTNFGTPVNPDANYAENGDRSYLFSATRGTEPGFGDVSMVFARPVASSSNRRIDFPQGCGLLTLLADLAAADPVRFPYDASGLVSYANLTRDALSRPLQQNDLDRLVLSFYPGATLDDLEASILNLDAIATERYELELTASRTLSLYDAVSPETGEPFSGFRRAEAGVWLLQLRCSTCAFGIPEVVVVLEPF